MARDHFLTSRTRSLRKNSTEAELRLWRVLRSRQHSGFKFRGQVEIAGYIVDFLCPERRLIIEVDGGQHTPQRDSPRTTYLESQGFGVIRFWNNDVLQNIEGVWSAIETALASAPTNPTR